jgi:uncharacterized protein (TIGR03086 family)
LSARLTEEAPVPDSPDLRPHLHRALDQAATVVEGVRPEQLSKPTPCSEFDVAALLEHLVGVGYRIASIGRREKLGPGLAKVSGIAPDRWPAAFGQARGEALEAWQDDSLLDEKIDLPFGTFVGNQVAGIYLLELTTHSWDLAAATGQTAVLDPELAEASMPIAKEVLPAEPRGGEIPFAAVVKIKKGAGPYERLAAWTGRRPVA